MVEQRAKPLMNYRRGLFRTWVVLSAIWSAVILIVALYEHHRIGEPQYRWLLSFWTDWLVAIFAPWVLTAAALGFRWTIKGFRSN